MFFLYVFKRNNYMWHVYWEYCESKLITIYNVFMS